MNAARIDSILARACIEALENRRMLNFSPATDYGVGTNPQAVVVADLNGDTRPDIAVANNSSNNVSVLLGNANGTFQPAQSSATGSGPQAIAVGDFDRDGKPDLVTTNSGKVSVLIGNGNGTFKAPADIDIGSVPSSVAVGDFNADGKLDLAVASNVYYPPYYGPYGAYPSYYNGRANVLLGSGTGTFAAPSTAYLFGPTYYAPPLISMAVADFNSDGKLDFAAASNSGGVSAVLMGTGTGSLTSLSSYVYFGYSPTSLVARDVSGDGKADLVAANGSIDSVNLALGNGAGGFGAVQNLPAGAGPSSVTTADFNGDAKIDLLTANVDGTLTVLLGAGGGTFKPPISLPHTTGAHQVAVGDFNGDARPDLTTSNAGGNNVSALLNNGSWLALTAPLLSVGDVTVTEGNTGTINASFAVNLSAPSTQTVTVHYATADGNATVAGGDYTAASGDITFAPGQTSKTIAVAVQGDRVGEPTESFAVRLNNIDNAFLSDSLGFGSILDDEPRITIDPSGIVTEGNTGTTPLSFNVRLDVAYDAPVTVNYSTAEGDTDLWKYDYYYYFPPEEAKSGVDFQAKTGTLTFAPGETTKTVTVLVNGDHAPESNEAFSVNLDTATGGAVFSGPHSLGFLGAHALGTITDDEPYLSIVGGSVTEGNSGTRDLSYTVTLSAASDVPVTVNYATNDSGATVAGGDYLAKSGTLTFAAGQTSKTITVQVKGDLLDEHDEALSVNLSDATNSKIAVGFAYGIIIDDDASPSMAVGNYSHKEGGLGTTLFTFTVSLSTASGRDVYVYGETANGTARLSDNDYFSTSFGVYISAGELSSVITVEVRGDTKKESNETFFVNLLNATNAGIADAQGVGTIVDDDTAAKTWTGPSGGNWSTAANWSPNGVPGVNDPVLISGKSVILSANATVNGLTLLSGASLTLAAAGNRVFRTTELATSGSSSLNLTDNAMVFDYGAADATPIDFVRQHLFAGRLLYTTTDPNRRLGYGESALLGKSSFSGQAVDATSVLLKYTRAGDSDLDGDADGVDMSAWARNFTGEQFGVGASSWTRGDWDYDGDVDGVDAGLWATAFTGELNGGV